MPFVIFGLPRSRTYWLSQFLTYGDWYCGHDELRRARSMEDVKAWFSQPNTGSVETLAAPWWRLLPKGTRTVVIRRPVSEVVESLMRLGPFDRDAVTRGMTRLDHKLDQIEARVHGVLSVQFHDLMNEQVCADVFEHCLRYKHDTAWWSLLMANNLQINMGALIRYMEAYAPQLDKFARVAKQVSISRMSRKSREVEGVSIQQESFDVFYRDSQHLFRDHMLVTGQDIEDYTRKNLPLMRRIDAMGNMQIMTARSNGRVFGYIMAVVAESMDGVDLFESMHMPFYASPEIPGLGMKLQRASIDGLREKGVSDLYFRAGVRGSGPRLGAMYRRLGAEDAGHLWRLRLKDAA